eukprot:CAMPEP_0196573194 /NCGR_PEP_ID=MMETSP1081-20130531/3133_1 /TAXON_ID=36882 /ORGANISM="Pyramimonas amylifera, Strain CCMP720" /LENGTH=437 /DNA_ID=CAMNT_0041890819 /DNA_START=191 /DNA_END=1504 /DNA_ORIENTATION=-
MGILNCFSPKFDQEETEHTKHVADIAHVHQTGPDDPIESPADTVHGGKLAWFFAQGGGHFPETEEIPLIFQMKNVPEHWSKWLVEHGRSTWPNVGSGPSNTSGEHNPGMKFRYSLATQRGMKAINQDAIMAWPSFLQSMMPVSDSETVTSAVQTKHNKHCSILGVYDGHGVLGHNIAQLARDFVPLHIRDIIQNLLAAGGAIDWPKVLSQAYNLSDADIRKLVGAKDQIVSGRVLDSRTAGTTGTTVILDGNLLHVASVGDSRVVLGRVLAGGKVEITYTSKEHRPTSPEEKTRIEKAGGFVRSVPTEPHRLRFWPPDVADAIQGKCELSSPGLCMSRAFGDSVLKNCGLSCEPNVDSIVLDPSETYIVLLCSDGIWDVVNSQQALQIAVKAKVDDNGAQRLVDHALYMWKQLFPSAPVDDIAVASALISANMETKS